MMCWFEAGSVCWKHVHFSYFKDTEFKMFTITNLDKQCLKIWMFEAKQSHWKEGGNAVRWQHSGGSWVSVEDCAERPIRSHASHQILWITHRVVRGLHPKSDTCTPPLITPLWLQRKWKKKFRLTLSFKDNSQHVQRGRALACLWKESSDVI